MNKYLIHWNRNDYGSITIKADTKEEAEELFLNGEFEEKDLFIKDGGFDIERNLTKIIK
jgi:hypothetical protein